MAAVRGLLSHPQQNKMMASSGYPEWMTAEHKTGVSKNLQLLFLCPSALKDGSYLSFFCRRLSWQ